jgi:RNA recognition motif-containing protein
MTKKRFLKIRQKTFSIIVFTEFSGLELKMSRHRDWDVSCKVYIGNLGNNASKYELEDAFSKYGPLKNVWVAR